MGVSKHESWLMVRDPLWIAISLLFLCLILTALFTPVGGGFILWIEKHPGLASWIQAVFSIFAIVFAFVVADYQNKLAIRNKITIDTERSEIAKLYLKGVLNHHKSIVEAHMNAFDLISMNDHEMIRMWLNKIEKDLKMIIKPDVSYISDIMPLGKTVVNSVMSPYIKLQSAIASLEMNSVGEEIFSKFSSKNPNAETIFKLHVARFKDIRKRTEDIFVAFQKAIIFFEEN